MNTTDDPTGNNQYEADITALNAAMRVLYRRGYPDVGDAISKAIGNISVTPTVRPAPGNRLHRIG